MMIERRVVLRRVVEGSALLVTGAIGVPVVLMAVSPTINRERRSDEQDEDGEAGARWVRIGRLEEFPVGEVREIVLGGAAGGWNGGLELPRHAKASPPRSETSEDEAFPAAEASPPDIAEAVDTDELAAPAQDTDPLFSEASGGLPRLVFVWRRAEQELIVMSRSCTDLGCPLIWDEGSECYLCPCHGGIFAKDGEVMAGPPSRPMYRYDTRVRDDGVIEVDVRSVPPMV